MKIRDYDMPSDYDIRLLGKAAGFLYLVIIVCGIGSEVFIRGGLYDNMDISVYTRFMADEYHAFVEPAYLVPLLAELAFCLWLLFGKFEQDRYASQLA